MKILSVLIKVTDFATPIITIQKIVLGKIFSRVKTICIAFHMMLFVMGSIIVETVRMKTLKFVECVQEILGFQV